MLTNNFNLLRSTIPHLNPKTLSGNIKKSTSFPPNQVTRFGTDPNNVDNFRESWNSATSDTPTLVGSGLTAQQEVVVDRTIELLRNPQNWAQGMGFFQQIPALRDHVINRLRTSNEECDQALLITLEARQQPTSAAVQTQASEGGEQSTSTGAPRKKLAGKLTKMVKKVTGDVKHYALPGKHPKPPKGGGAAGTPTT